MRDFRARLAPTLGTVLVLGARLIAGQLWFYTQGLSAESATRILAFEALAWDPGVELRVMTAGKFVARYAGQH